MRPSLIRHSRPYTYNFVSFTIGMYFLNLFGTFLPLGGSDGSEMKVGIFAHCVQGKRSQLLSEKRRCSKKTKRPENNRLGRLFI